MGRTEALRHTLVQVNNVLMIRTAVCVGIAMSCSVLAIIMCWHCSECKSELLEFVWEVELLLERRLDSNLGKVSRAVCKPCVKWLSDHQ